MNKKILFFCSVTKIGGAETNIIKISHELAQRGYEVHFATLEDNGPMFNSCRDIGKSFTEIGLFLDSPLQSIKKFTNLLKEHQFAAVFNFGLRVELFSRILTKLFSARTRSIANIRSTNAFRKIYQVLLDRSTSFLVDEWVSNSEAGKRIYLQREKIDARKIKVIYNFIETIPLEKVVHRIMKSNEVRIGILSRIKKLKGHYDLIPLTKELLKFNIKPLFILAGLDNTNDDFEQQVKSNRYEEYFEFRGFTEDRDQFFADIDIFMLPSYLEGMPTSILEAMAYQKPIVTTNIDGIPEQIENGVNGFALPPGDFEGFARAIKRIVEDDYLRHKFVERNMILIESTFKKEEKIEEWIKVITG